jgi:hypothetical protein
LDGANSRFAPRRELTGNGLIYHTIFMVKQRMAGGIGENSRFDGKNRD